MGNPGLDSHPRQKLETVFEKSCLQKSLAISFGIPALRFAELVGHTYPQLSRFQQVWTYTKKCRNNIENALFRLMSGFLQCDSASRATNCGPCPAGVVGRDAIDLSNSKPVIAAGIIDHVISIGNKLTNCFIGPINARPASIISATIPKVPDRRGDIIGGIRLK